MAHMCKVCRKTFSSPADLAAHFKVNHSISGKSAFMCGLPNCTLRFVDVKSYAAHISSPFHRRNGVPVPQVSEVSNAQSLKKCPQCKFTSSNSSTLRSHRNRKHGQSAGTSGAVEVNAINSDPSSSSFATEFGASLAPDTSTSISSEGASAEIVVGAVEPHVVREKFIQLFSTLNSVHHVPQSVLQHSIETYQHLLQLSDTLVCREVAEKFGRLQLDPTGLQLKIVQSALADSVASFVHSTQGPLRSSYIRCQNFSSAETYVPPVSHYLGTDATNKHRKYHTVPVTKSLKIMFQDDSIYEQYIDNQSRRYASGEEFRDIFDGLLWQMTVSDPATLVLLVYTDDLELCNPIGSSKTVHKVTNIYIAVANLHPWTRTKRQVMMLALTCREKDVAYFGLPKVLKPLITELQELEVEGMEIRGKSVKVKVLLLLGDNLGTHTITGFLENFSTSTYFCRYCEETRSQWKGRWARAVGGLHGSGDEDEEEEDDDDDNNDHDPDGNDRGSGIEYDDDDSDSGDDLEDSIEDNNSVISDSDCFQFADLVDITSEVETECVPDCADLRTEEEYDQCVEAVSHLPEGSNVKGIVACCQFNKLNGYHCARRSPPCVAHDIHEGIIPKDVGIAVKHICEENDITVEFLNLKMRTYPLLGVDRSDRPAVISKNFKICGNAVQNGVFLRFLPIVLGPHIKDKSDPVWQMILLLREIVQTVTSPVISKAGLPKLKCMIRAYLFQRRKLFPNVPLRPKHHYLEHYPALIEIFGPLMRSSTLGFEAKHPFFKATLRAKKSCKNLTKLLSNEHQLMMSNLSTTTLVDNFPFVMSKDQSDLTPELNAAITTFFGDTICNLLTYSTGARFRGTEYNKGEVVVHPVQSLPDLQLCAIQCLITVGQDCYAAGFRSRGTEVCGLGVHEVTQSQSVLVINLSKLKDYSCYPLYKVHQKEVIILKHRVI